MQTSLSESEPTQTAPLLADYWTPEELAKELARRPSTLKRWERLGKGKGPPITRIGRQPYYLKESVIAWLRAREQKSHTVTVGRQHRGSYATA